MSRSFFAALGIIAPLVFSHSAMAGVGKVSSPDVSKGAFEVEYSGTRTSDNVAARNNKQSHTAEFEYGFTDRLMLGLEVKGERSATEKSRVTGYGIEGQYQLTKQQDWWLASAIKAKYLHATRHSDADEAEAKLLLSRKQGKFKTVANLSLERELGNNRGHGVALSSALQGLYDYHEHLKPGLEWHAEYGPLNDLNNQNHREHYVGPVLTGELFDLGAGEIEYVAGYYWGLTNNSADQAARVQIGYEFHF